MHGFYTAEQIEEEKRDYERLKTTRIHRCILSKRTKREGQPAGFFEPIVIDN
jgi:hypothetical protein